ncbi:XRE family transcriptional regulator [Brevibacillus laterosporus]|uniref:XRE family transcriptional regulator n=1 Tax=Brevibacillus laterosporus TaxID=1465 RepID=UPI0024053BE8|nr:XRE family transcriptional regulator [Brevibacillus laterosporus]MDF9412956.1 XRE family transcriptional regulator [Brevibacillus laterosporus]
MKYANILREYIEGSCLSLSQICNQLQEYGFKTNKGYLSKLQNGKIPPAGDKLNDAISKIIGIDGIKLKAAAYRERIPNDVLQELKREQAS